MDELVRWARDAGFDAVVLGTTSVMERAHRFYERQGFESVPRDDLPPEFPFMAADSVFYRLAL